MHGNFGLPCSGFKALYNGAGVKNGLFHPFSIFGTTFDHWPNNRRDFNKKSLMPILLSVIDGLLLLPIDE